MWGNRDWLPRPNARFLEDWLAHCCELADAYRPQLFYFDWWIRQIIFEPYIQRFAAYYYNRGQEWNLPVAINCKNEAFPEGTVVFDVERGQLRDIRPLLWQTDTPISKNSWGMWRSRAIKPRRRYAPDRQGSDQPVEWSRSASGLQVNLSAHAPLEPAFVLKIEGNATP